MAPVQYKVSFADDFLDQISPLDPADHKRVMESVRQLQKNPDSPGLRLKSLSGGLKGLMSIRAAQDLRVLIERRGNALVVLTGGARQDVYDKAERGRLVINDRTSFIGFVSPATTTEGDQRSAPTRVPASDVPRPFDHWSDAELADAGLGPDAIAELRSLTSELGFFELDLSPEHQELAIDLIELTPEARAKRLSATDDDAAAIDAEDESRLVDAVNRFGALAGLSPFMTEDELEHLLAAPIEEWMLFLHPDQRSVVERRYSGPARIRGSAGTGKTVVALHRAAVLAKRYDPMVAEDGGRILVTTFINSLPPVLERLFRRLPNARPELVDFTNVDKLAARVCRDAGRPAVYDPNATKAAQAKAWKQVFTAGSPLAKLGVTEGYASEEVTAVIKGRGILDLDSYLTTKRTGRRLQLSESARRQVWEFAESWNDGLRQRGVQDFSDVVLQARDIARSRSEPMYRCALIDEAQDLTLVGLQLIRSLVNGPGGDQPDGIFLAGDGAQRIYPGGFTLRQAGLEVRGRTTVLRVNYRNTAEVLGVALATTGADTIEDLDEEFTRGEDAGETTRQGDRPTLLVASDDEEQVSIVAATIERLADDENNGIASGDIAVLCPTNKLANTMRAALADAHIPTINLNDYDGESSESIKVGTLHRVKGLEFKAVVLTDLSDGVYPRRRPDYVTPAAWADQEATMANTLFVAMTRARDQLVLTCVRDPSPILEGAFSRLDLVGAVVTD